MAIQLAIKKKWYSRINNRLGLYWQIFKRALRSNKKVRVFYRYQASSTHPSFSRYYDHPPVQWSNNNDAHLFHWVSYPQFIDHRPFIIEPNDHPLSAHMWNIRSDEPGVAIKSIQDATFVYQHNSCKSVFLDSQEQIKLFKYYMPEDTWHKVKLIPCIGAIPKKIDWDTKENTERITFVCLASDYSRKAIDLILTAWLNTPNHHEGQLILACPNVPVGIKKMIMNESVELIEKAPLTAREKNKILQRSHVALGPTHIDGGGNVIEAMEFGLAIALMKYHRHDAFINPSNGILVNVPYYFYSPEYYGHRWKTFSEFLLILEEDKEKGVFNSTIDQWVEVFRYYLDSPVLAIEHGRESYKLASTKLSLEYRNSVMLSNYQNILGVSCE